MRRIHLWNQKLFKIMELVFIVFVGLAVLAYTSKFTELQNVYAS